MIRRNARKVTAKVRATAILALAVLIGGYAVPARAALAGEADNFDSGRTLTGGALAVPPAKLSVGSPIAPITFTTLSASLVAPTLAAPAAPNAPAPAAAPFTLASPAATADAFATFLQASTVHGVQPSGASVPHASGSAAKDAVEAVEAAAAAPGNETFDGTRGAPSLADGDAITLPKEVPVLPIPYIPLKRNDSMGFSFPEEQEAEFHAAAASHGNFVLLAGPADQSEGGTELGHFTNALLVQIYRDIPEHHFLIAAPIRRARIVGYAPSADGVDVAKVEYFDEAASDPIKVEKERRALLRLIRTMRAEGFLHPDDETQAAMKAAANDPEELLGIVATNVTLDLEAQHKIGGAGTLDVRLKALREAMTAMRVDAKISLRMNEKMQRGMIRQKIEELQAQLGEEDKEKTEADKLRERVKASGMSAQARAAAEREISRMERSNQASPEYSKSTEYVGRLLKLPWGKMTKDHFDMAAARVALDKDHEGLEKVKLRVMEFLAERKHAAGASKAPILLFSGPPGVGKTSIGTAIAEALGRKFVSMPLGGVTDEKKIRGFQMTYTNSKQGIIMAAIRDAGTDNPVILLDEIDKMGHSEQGGDPSSAMLEVLDPAQNKAFKDTYFEVPYDLSNVIFIVTANDVSKIPKPLYDRMEKINFSGYTTDQKIGIARKIAPKKISEKNLAAPEARFTKAALRYLIESYTREGGVRELQRQLDTVLRKVITSMEVDGKRAPGRIGVAEIKKYLGPVRFRADDAVPNGVGKASGLSWSEAGGNVLDIEAVSWNEPGGPKLTVTGKPGDVMKESVQIALNYLKANRVQLGIPDKIFTDSIHVHIPDGATPKDGPSAGAAFTLAIMSRLTGRAIKPGIAMTGEVDLLGRVLPIGGLDQKIPAAYAAGLKTVLYPKANANDSDISDLPRKLRRDMNLIPVSSMAEVIALALEPAPNPVEKPHFGLGPTPAK